MSKTKSFFNHLAFGLERGWGMAPNCTQAILYQHSCVVCLYSVSCRCRVGVIRCRVGVLFLFSISCFSSRKSVSFDSSKLLVIPSGSDSFIQIGELCPPQVVSDRTVGNSNSILYLLVTFLTQSKELTFYCLKAEVCHYCFTITNKHGDVLVARPSYMLLLLGISYWCHLTGCFLALCDCC